MKIDPKEFGLDGRTVIEKDKDGCFCIVIDRKSRIIMADGRKIMEKAAKIKRAVPGAIIKLKASAPLCSKTRLFLEKEGIEILGL